MTRGMEVQYSDSTTHGYVKGKWIQVNVVNRDLLQITEDQLLSYWKLSTLLLQVEGLMNSRSLCQLSADLSALPQPHFLHQAPLQFLLAEELTYIHENRLDRFPEFLGWPKEHLTIVQIPQKCNRNWENIIVGTVVILMMDNTPTLQWPLGIVKDLLQCSRFDYAAVRENLTDSRGLIMSSEKCSDAEEVGKLEEGRKKEKKKNRKLSWQETPRTEARVPREDIISLETNLENGKAGSTVPYGSISDGELPRNSRRTRSRGLEGENPSTEAFRRSSHRRVKSLIRFELSDYNVKDVQENQKEAEDRQAEPSTSKGLRGFSRRQLFVLACLCLVDFTSFCSISIMAPFFPEEAMKKGMSEMTSGFVFSFDALLIFLSAPFFGKILPHAGAKFLFLSGLFVTSNCNLLFGLLQHVRDDLTFAIFCFLVQGLKALGSSAYWTASYVFVVEVFPENIGTVMGLMETFVGLGMSIGPAIGGFFYHVGGFGLPFYVLGGVLLLTFPIAYHLLPLIQGSTVKKKSTSFMEIVKDPSVLINGMVVVVTSNVWSFLDPTLEPHLRQFGLTPEKVGLIFLLFSALYGLSSPLWGLVSDKTNNHWFMMTSGLLVSTIALLLLGPAPFIPFLKGDLTLNLVALSILGASISLSLLPTFPGLLSAILSAKGTTESDVATYSIVAGTWSSLYALGEVIGPFLGGVLMHHYGFPTSCIVVAGATFTLAVGSFVYFFIRDCLAKRANSSDSNYRYNFEDGDGYDSDYSNISDDARRPILKRGCQNRLYTRQNSF